MLDDLTGDTSVPGPWSYAKQEPVDDHRRQARRAPYRRAAEYLNAKALRVCAAWWQAIEVDKQRPRPQRAGSARSRPARPPS